MRRADIIDLPPLAVRQHQNSRLKDSHGRQFEYLRLSLTDVCNFRCSYCLPSGYRKDKRAAPYLTATEYVRLVKAFARLGLWKVRLTGGEPTIRKDFLAIAEKIREIRGIRRLALTTNGYRLAERAQSYADVGIGAINVSIDSLQAAQFHKITGHNRLSEILRGVEACQSAGMRSVKINIVLMRGANDREIDDFIDFVRERDVTLRFIELMRTNDNVSFFAKHHISARLVSERLLGLGWRAQARAAGAGPAIEYTHAGSRGRIGIIAPYAPDFCTSCNRLRVSARGALHLCLFSEQGYDLRAWLRSDSQADELIAHIQGLMGAKLSTHRLHHNNSGATPHLASIGG